MNGLKGHVRLDHNTLSSRAHGEGSVTRLTTVPLSEILDFPQNDNVSSNVCMPTIVLHCVRSHARKRYDARIAVGADGTLALPYTERTLPSQLDHPLGVVYRNAVDEQSKSYG